MGVLRVALVALALLLLAPSALAQTSASPIVGKYDEVYVIAGRVLDSQGLPVSGGIVWIELLQEGVKAEPLRATANCKGDFITAFTLVHVDPRGQARVTLVDETNQIVATTTVALDPFFRRSDTVLTMDEPWNATCTRETNVWPVSASMSVRLLNRTEPYKSGEETFHARPYTGIIRLRLETNDGNTVCPPHPQDQRPGACETFVVDERGDMRYTFTLDAPTQGDSRIEIILQDNSTLSVPVDGKTRLGVEYFEVTGQGAPPELYETPGLRAGALLALSLVLALALRGKR